MKRWDELNRRIVGCQQCVRLREYCAEVARTRRRAYLDWEYWGKPVPNFGDPKAQLLIVGLAPAAHGANRTGRMFTGDRSGEWLFRALGKFGFASQRTSTDCDDGLVLRDCAITAACHCAPPGNKPSNEEFANCSEWLKRTMDLVPARVFLALGQIAWRVLSVELRSQDWLTGPLPKFGHARAVQLSAGRWLIGCYHPSQQNTFTGRLTESMLDGVVRNIKRLLLYDNPEKSIRCPPGFTTPSSPRRR